LVSLVEQEQPALPVDARRQATELLEQREIA
jgi:hypothetical protein